MKVKDFEDELESTPNRVMLQAFIGKEVSMQKICHERGKEGTIETVNGRIVQLKDSEVMVAIKIPSFDK